MGRYYLTKGKWLKFDGNQLHAVEEVKDSLARYSMSGQANYWTGHSWPGLEDLSYLGVSGSNVNCDSIEIGDDSTAHTLLMTAAGVATADPVIWRRLGNKAMITSAIKRIRQKRPKIVVVDAHLTEIERSMNQEDFDKYVRSPLKTLVHGVSSLVDLCPQTVFAILSECGRDPISTSDKQQLQGTVGQYQVRSPSSVSTHYVLTNLPKSHLSYIVSPTSDGVGQHLLVLNRLHECLKYSISPSLQQASSYNQELFIDSLFTDVSGKESK
eukprot:4288676-Amphidinium_carterae.1